MPFSESEVGATGLELLLPLTLKWARETKLPLARALAKVTSDAARVLGVKSGRLTPGAPADLVIFDPDASFPVTAGNLKSQGKNTPFIGYELQGRTRYTLVAGNVVFTSSQK